MVWEPVLSSDHALPTNAVLARAADKRVAQFWDKQTALSQALSPVLKADNGPVVGKDSLVTGKIVWDFVGVYPAGVRWEGAAPPAPVFKAAPVAQFLPELRQHLATQAQYAKR